MLILDEETGVEAKLSPSTLAFWLGKRLLIYNLAVGLAGVFGLLPFFWFAYISLEQPDVYLASLGYGFLANLAYSLGLIFEFILRAFKLSTSKLQTYRRWAWRGGFIFALVFTLGFALFVFALAQLSASLSDF